MNKLTFYYKCVAIFFIVSFLCFFISKLAVRMSENIYLLSQENSRRRSVKNIIKKQKLSDDPYAENTKFSGNNINKFKKLINNKSIISKLLSFVNHKSIKFTESKFNKKNNVKFQYKYKYLLESYSYSCYNLKFKSHYNFQSIRYIFTLIYDIFKPPKKNTVFL